MKSKWIIASLLIIALLAICGASMYAIWAGVQLAPESGIHLRLEAQTTSAKATEEKTLAVSGPAELTVVNDFGDVSVVGGPDGKIGVVVEKTAWGGNDTEAQAALKDLKIIYDQNGNKLKITVQQPVEVNTLQIGPGGGNFQFTIQVPQDTAVTVNSSNGNLTLSGTSGNADLQSEFGNLELTNLTGEVFGQTSNGSLTAKNLNSEQKVTLSTEFGGITAEKVRGSELTIDTTNGQLDLTGLQASGLLKATSEYGPINLSDSQAGTALVGSENGDVTLVKLSLTGKLSAKSNFGGLFLTSVKASAYELVTQNGKIKVDWAQGPIMAHSEFGEVEILNAENATLDLSSNNGGVNFAGSLGAGPHRVMSEFGELKLSLPAETAIDADLQTEFGEISSDFDLTLTVKGEVEKKHLQGKINGGGALLTVKTNNGNILLETLK